MDHTHFTAEELNLMCIYDTSSRAGLMAALSQVRRYLPPDEEEMCGMIDRVLELLSRMTDEAFSRLTLVPDFEV